MQPNPRRKPTPPRRSLTQLRFGPRSRPARPLNRPSSTWPTHRSLRLWARPCVFLLRGPRCQRALRPSPPFQRRSPGKTRAKRPARARQSRLRISRASLCRLPLQRRLRSLRQRPRRRSSPPSLKKSCGVRAGGSLSRVTTHGDFSSAAPLHKLRAHTLIACGERVVRHAQRCMRHALRGRARRANASTRRQCVDTLGAARLQFVSPRTTGAP